MKRFIIAATLIILTAMAKPSFAADPGITLYSSLSYARLAAHKFSRGTGIPVRVVAAKSADILLHITQQGHHPRWSVAWFDGATSAVMLDQAGLLAHHLPVPPHLTKSGTQLISPNGAWVPTGMTLAGILVTAANPYVTPPGAWSALTEPAYHGIIGIDDPQLTRGAYSILAGLLQANGGWPQGKSFINNLKHDGLHIYADDAGSLAALRSGSVSIAIVRSSVAFDDAETHGKSLRLAFPKPVFAMPGVIVMAKNLRFRQRKDARWFIRFISTPSIQKLLIEGGGSDSWYWPVTSQPAPHPGLPPLASLDVRVLDAQHWGQLQPRVMNWFNKDIVGPGN